MSAPSSTSPMRLIRTWFDLRIPISGAMYFWSGVGLMVFKYAVEATAVWNTIGKFYTPFHFLAPMLSNRDAFLAPAPDWVAIGILLWSMPFTWIAVSMSIRRATLAGWSPWQGLWVIVPFINIPAMLILAAAPDRSAEAATGSRSTLEISASSAPSDQHHAKEVLSNLERRLEEEVARERSSIKAILAGLLSPFVLFPFGALLLHDYGITLFYVTPFLAGVITGYVANRKHNQGLFATTCIAATMTLCALGMLLVFALEGAICIAMAAPVVIPLGIAGSWIGWAIAIISPGNIRCALPCIVLLPVGTFVEDRVHTSPLYSVESSVVIDAPPQVVWQKVVEFPDLAEPTEWYFRAGIACPTGATIEGEGTSAVRYCRFTTGVFVEPVTVWDPPRRLAFDVTSQPEPMFELSPYHNLHPPHMHGTFVTDRGEFRLVELSDGRTRLEGTTWFRIEMGPTAYWKLWCDGIIHGIHNRVLEHIRELAETDR